MNLRRTAYSAGRWTSASLLIRVVLQFAQMAIFARLLIPADFGLMAIAGAAYAMAAVFVDLGLSNAIIHYPDPTPRVLSTLYWLNLATSVLVMGVFIAISLPLAHIYHEPRLAPLMLLMSLTLPLSALGQQFRVLAEKSLKFTKLASIEICSSIIGFGGGIAAAVMGAGVYSLVVTALLTAAVSSACSWALISQGFRPRGIFEFRSASAHLRYGMYRLGDTLLINAQLQADLFVGGYFSSSSTLGLYTVPRNLSLRLANSFVNPVVTRVGLPVMAKLQHDRDALRSVYLQTLRITASINFPVYSILAIWPGDAVRVLLGEQWSDSAALLRIFAIWGMIRSTSNPLGSLLYATGYVRRAFWWNLSVLALLPAVLWIAGGRFGLMGIALSLVLIQGVLFIPLFHYLVRPACGAAFGEYVAQAGIPLTACLVSGAGAWIVVTSVPAHMQFICGTVSFVLSYLAVSAWINEPWLRSIRELLAPAIPRRRRHG